MIHKDWKKRLRSFKKDKMIHFAVIGIIMGIGLILGLTAGIAAGKLLKYTLLGTTFAGCMASMFYVSEIFITKNSELDNEIEDEIEAKKTIQDENHETYHRHTWDEGKQKIWRASNYDDAFHDKIHELLSAIDYILNNCSLSEKEIHHLIQDFPNEFSDVLTGCQNLRGEHQERMKKRILDFISSKLAEWNAVYIHPVQDALEKDCLQKLEKASRTKEEKVYMTE